MKNNTLRAASMIGYLDFVSRKLITGWALDSVDIFIDDILLTSVSPDQPRPDVIEQYQCDDHVGFQTFVNLPRTDEKIIVSVRFSGTGKDLHGSPVTLPPISQVQSIDNPAWYASETKKWLDNRFGGDISWINGIYNGHQPMYGYAMGSCEPGWYDRYVISYHILTLLTKVKGESLLDVGGAEGYKAALIREKIPGFRKIVSADLSIEACKKAERIYDVETRQIDTQKLPFGDDEFDIVLSSETIEHLSDPDTAVMEMIRVARNAVVITVPCQPEEEIVRSILGDMSHDHINCFHLESFEKFKPFLESVQIFRINSKSKWLREFADRLENTFPEAISEFPHLQDRLLGLHQAESMKTSMASLIGLDGELCLEDDNHKGMMALLLKNNACKLDENRANIKPVDILNFAVPYVRKGQIQDMKK